MDPVEDSGAAPVEEAAAVAEPTAAGPTDTEPVPEPAAAEAAESEHELPAPNGAPTVAPAEAEGVGSDAEAAPSTPVPGQDIDVLTVTRTARVSWTSRRRPQHVCSRPPDYHSVRTCRSFILPALRDWCWCCPPYRSPTPVLLGTTPRDLLLPSHSDRTAAIAVVTRRRGVPPWNIPRRGNAR